MSEKRATKKAELQKWHRDRKRSKNIIKLVLIGICIVAVAGICFVGWDMWSRSFVMTFDGQRIPTSDARFFSAFADGGPDFRDQAIEGLTHFLLVDRAARHYNIILTEEELEEVTESAAELRQQFEMFGIPLRGVSDDRLIELVSMDVLSERLFDMYTADVAIDDEAEFSRALNEFLEEHRDDFVDMEFRFHLSSAEMVSQSAWLEFGLNDPAEFNNIIVRDMALQTGIDEDDIEVPSINLASLRQDPNINPQIIDYLMSLEVGDFSEPIQVDEDTFVIFIVDGIDIPTDEELSELYREDYILTNRLEAFEEAMENWREATDIEINPRGVNAV